jgi:cytochrome P450
MHVEDLPFLDILSPDFEYDSPSVKAARDESWLARTPIGFAVLRYDEVSAILKDGRLHQGSAAILAMRGVTDGPLVDWWKHTLLNIDGAEHTRQRRLVAKAFTPPAVERLRPYFRATAERLIDGFGPDGRCEFVSAFSEPYPLEGICEMLGIPAERRQRFYGWAAGRSSAARAVRVRGRSHRGSQARARARSRVGVGRSRSRRRSPVRGRVA